MATVLGLLGGSVVFFLGDWWIDSRGGHRRKSPNGPQAGAAGTALALGALLDGIPESAAIGVSTIGGGGVGVAVVAAVFLSNIPEGLSSSAGMRSAGHSAKSIMGIWLGVDRGGDRRGRAGSRPARRRRPVGGRRRSRRSRPGRS